MTAYVRDQEVLRRSILALKFFIPLRSFLLISSFLVPLYRRYELSYIDIYFLEASWAIVIVMLEVPAGVLADRYGRSASLRLGALLTTAAFSCYLHVESFQGFLLAHLCFAIGYCFISGCDRALAYECYVALGHGPSYRMFERVSSSFSGFVEALAGIVGALLIRYDFYAPFVAQVICSTGLIATTVYMRDPKRSVVFAKSACTKFAITWKDDGKRFIFYDRMWYAALLATMTHTMVVLTPVYYEHAGFPLEVYSLLWSCQLAWMGFCSALVLRVEMMFGRERIFKALPCIGILSYLGIAIGMSQSVYPFLFGFYCIRGVLGPLLHHEIHDVLEDGYRATMFSLINMAQKLLYAILGMGIGVLMDYSSLEASLFVSALVYSLLSGAYFWYRKGIRMSRCISMRSNSIFGEIASRFLL